MLTCTNAFCRFLLATLLLLTHLVEAQTSGVKNIVLVHGAFADGSSWANIIPLLEAKGLTVVAVQNPLTSLSDDIAAVKRSIASLDGPVLLVGHSWGGVVISGAGNDPKVVGLVYVAAFAPNDAQSLIDASQTAPPAPGLGETKPDAAGFLSLTLKGVHDDFAQDLPLLERKVVWATQGPWAAATSEKITKAAWRLKPTWYIVASEDRMINPDLERQFARKMKATTLTLKTSHVPMLSQPVKVAAFIAEAAGKVKPQ